MRWTVVAAWCALALGGAAQAKDRPGSAQAGGPGDTAASGDVARQLEPALQRFADSWNREDLKAMASSFAEDAVLINPSGRIARGRAEIEKLFQDEHVGGALQGTRFTHRLTDVRQVAPNLVFIDEEITISGAHDPNGRALPDMNVHGAMLLANRGGTWQVLEGRPYVFAPRGPRGATAGGAPAPGTTGGEQQTGSGSVGSSAPQNSTPRPDR